MSITRFAPSPTGWLHLGHAAAALFAREHGDRCLLRIEDIDPARCRPEYHAAIEEDLSWLGLAWDAPVRVQSAHFQEYAAALARLRADGLLYPCFCTRAEVAAEAAAAGHAPHGPEGVIYPGTCRALPTTERDVRLKSGAPHTWRLDMTEATHRTGPLMWHEASEGPIPCTPDTFGDVVLARRDTPASYHLCVTHDDAVQGVTLVTRSVDLRPTTSVHRVLQTLLGWPEPHYAHHPMLLDAAGRRLSKRDGAISLRTLRANGTTPEQARSMARFVPVTG